MSTFKVISLFISILALLIVVTCSDKSTSPPNNLNVNSSRNMIAYLLTVSGSNYICVVKSDGTSHDTLTTSNDYNLVWSPDGTKILFSRYNDRWELYTMNADGTNQAKLTPNSVAESFGHWSPDGTKILFSANLGTNYEIYMINSDGTNMTNLTNNSAGDYSPYWSPDGSKIAFHSRRDANYAIYVMDANGGNQTKITIDPFSHRNPVWSPDGSKIACDYNNPTGDYLKTIRSTGGGARFLVEPSDNNPLSYSWSPDGSQIAFFANASTGGREIFLVDTAATAIVNISNSEGYDEGPYWSPDGTKIVFNSDRSDDYGLYLMNPDGSSQVKIIGHTSGCWNPVWSPVM